MSVILAKAPPTISDYNPPGGADDILGWLAWIASAAGILGLIIVGTQMSLQLRRGEMGEGGAYFKGFFIVMCASAIAATAGPLVRFFGPYNL